MSLQPNEIPGLKRQFPQSPFNDHEASIKRTAFDAEVSSLNPQEFSPSPTADVMAVNAYAAYNPGSQSDRCYYVSSTLPANSQDYSSQLLKDFKEEDVRVVTGLVEDEVVNQPLPAQPKALAYASTQVNSTIERATTDDLSSTRHPLPSPPSTPALGSSPCFPSHFAPSSPNLRPSTPATTPTQVRNDWVTAYADIEYLARRNRGSKTHKTRMPRRPILAPHTENLNPFIDFREVTGYTPADMYYKTRSFIYDEVLVNEPTVGPFRKAAVYEFAGQTFHKYKRAPGKHSHHRRHQTYRAGQDDGAAGSKLRQVISVDEIEEDVEMSDAAWPDR